MKNLAISYWRFNKRLMYKLSNLFSDHPGWGMLTIVLAYIAAALIMSAAMP